MYSKALSRGLGTDRSDDAVPSCSTFSNNRSAIDITHVHVYGEALNVSGVLKKIGESEWNLWVWLVAAVSRRWVWLVSGIYGCG